MTKEKTTGKGLKIIHWLRMGVILLLAVIIIFLLVLALTPTGYKEFEQSHLESARKVDSWIRSEVAKTQRPSGSYHSVYATSSSTPNPEHLPPPLPDPLSSSGRKNFYQGLGDVLSIQDTGTINLEQLFGPLVAIQWSRLTFSKDIPKSYSLRSIVESDPLIRREILRKVKGSIAALPPAQETYDADLLYTGMQENTTRTLVTKLRAKINSILDNTERFLLAEEWDIPDFSLRQGQNFVSLEWFYRFAALAILRADLGGDQVKTLRLLTRTLEAMRIDTLQRFPISAVLHLGCGGESNFSFSQSIALTLDMCTTLDDRAFSQVSPILDKSLLTPEQFNNLMDAYALRTNRIFKHGDLPSRNNVWHRMLGGFPESLVFQGLRPAAAHCLERSTLAWSDTTKRDSKMINVLLYEALSAAMNIDTTFLDNSIRNPSNPSIMTGPDGENFNQDIHLMRLVLACVRWHRLHGHYPARIGELAPTYLDRKFTDSPFSGWMVLSYISPGSVERPVFCYFDLYPARNGNNVTESQISILVGTPIMPMFNGRIINLLRNP